jgi:tetratricopeptide (TPR) repeat protein
MGKHRLGAIGLAAAMALAGGAARAAVTVEGSGLASECAKAAKDGETAITFERICTQSLETELLPPRDRSGTYVNRGIIKLRNQQYDSAIEDFDTAIKYQSNLAEAYVNRGAARIGAHRFKEAVADLDNAILLGVQEPEKAYYNRAVAYEWLDNYKAAYFDYKKALELAPDWDLVNQQLARFTVSHADVPAQAAAAKP